MVEVKDSKQAFLQAGDAQRIDGSPSGNLQPRGVGGGAGRGSLEARSSAEALPALPDPRLLNFRSRSQGIRLLHSKAWCLEKACPSFLAAARLGSVRGFGAMRGIKAVPWTDPVLGDRKDSRSQGIYCEPIAGSLRQLREGRDLLRPRSCPLSQAPGAHVRRVWRKRGWSLTTVLIGCPDSREFGPRVSLGEPRRVHTLLRLSLSRFPLLGVGRRHFILCFCLVYTSDSEPLLLHFVLCSFLGTCCYCSKLNAAG